MKTKNFYKNIFGGVLLAATVGMATACDPLGVEPTTTVDEARFWENPQLARAYVNNFYFIGSSASGDTFQSEQWSDNCQGNCEGDWDTYYQNGFNQRQYDANTSQSEFSAPWSGSYKNIRNIYVGINNISASAGLDASTKNQLLGECYFFLAYVYFDMIKFWGVVPYVDKALNVTDETFLPQSKREELFDNILANLDLSLTHFIDAAIPSHTAGMVNEDVVNAFKSRVALYAACAAEASAKGLHSGDLYKFEKQASHYYDLAYKAADAVKGYSLEPDYATLFTSTEAHKSAESIWPVMFKLNQRSGFNPTSKNGPDGAYYGGNEEFTANWDIRSGLFPTQDLVDAYLMKDEATGKYKNWWETSQMQALGITKNAQGEIVGETENYRDMFKNRDKRFYSTVTYDGAYMGPEQEMYLVQTWVDDSKMDESGENCISLKYSALHAGMRTMTKLTSVPQARASAQTLTGYYSRKYSQFEFYQNGKLNTEQKTTCYFNIRYAEVLLNKAEAAIKLGGKDTEAKNLINQIRNRAGIGNYEGTDLMTELKTQRRLEFAFECPGFRYFDLLRWGEAEGKKTIDELNKPSRGLWISRKGIESEKVGENGYPAEPGDEGYYTPTFKTFSMSIFKTSAYNRKFDNARYYFMPYSITTLNDYTQLTQNPGWTGFNFNN